MSKIPKIKALHMAIAAHEELFHAPANFKRLQGKLLKMPQPDPMSKEGLIVLAQGAAWANILIGDEANLATKVSLAQIFAECMARLDVNQPAVLELHKTLWAEAKDFDPETCPSPEAQLSDDHLTLLTVQWVLLMIDLRYALENALLHEKKTTKRPRSAHEHQGNPQASS